MVVPKLQERKMYVLRGDVQLEHCKTTNVPIFSQSHKMIWITILLRNTVVQKLMSPSSIRFIVTQKHTSRNAYRIKNKRCGCGTRSGRCWGSQVERRVAFLSKFLGGFRTWKSETQSIQLYYREPQRRNCWQKSWSFLLNLKCASKLSLAFGFIFRKIEDGGFRYFYRHENNTPLDRSKLVCTNDDLAKLKSFLSKSDVIESCSRERMNTKWRFYKLTNLTVVATLLKGVPMGCKDAFLPKPLSENGTIHCLTFDEKKIQGNHKTTTCVLFVLLLSICMSHNEWKKKFQKFSNCSLTK